MTDGIVRSEGADTMGFLAPALLAALAALAIPLLLHLRQRDRQRPRPFPSLMFLSRVPIRTDKRRRMTDLPLLLLRALAVALLVAAFARPFLRSPAAGGAGEPGLTVLLVDRSQSMGTERVQAALRDTVAAVLAQLPPGGRVAVIGYDVAAEVLAAPTTDRAMISTALAGATPRASGTRHASGMRAVAQLVAAEPIPAEVVVLTDAQRAPSGDGEPPTLPTGTRVRVAALAPPVRDNAGVVHVEVQPLPERDGRRAAIAAQVSRTGGTSDRPVSISLLVDGREAAIQRVVLPPRGNSAVAFDTVALPRGNARIEVVMSGDALPADDRFHAVVSADAGLRVALVAASTAEGRFVERALEVGDAPAIVVERLGALDPAALARATVVWLHDVPPPGGDLGAALEAWVAAGGGVVLSVGPRLARDAPGLSGFPAAIRGARAREGATLGEAATAHPALAPFRSAATDPLATVRVREQPRLEPHGAGQTLLRFDDGTPALVVGTRGAGRMAVVGVPLELGGGDFPLQPSFLPFARGLVAWAARTGQAASSLTGGDPWLLPATLRAPVLRSPSGDLPLVRDGSVVLPPESGVHELFEGRPGGVPVSLMAVNAPPGESDLTAGTGEAILPGAHRTAPGGTAATVAASALELERRQSGWRWVLMAVLLVLVSEVLVASRGWRGMATVTSTGGTA